MPIGKSRRIVIDVEDLEMKRNLYAALAVEGRSLKEWFASAASEYLSVRAPKPARISEKPAARYHTARKGTGS